ncbi:PHD finger protein 20, partial [Podila humilis]
MSSTANSIQRNIRTVTISSDEPSSNRGIRSSLRHENVKRGRVQLRNADSENDYSVSNSRAYSNLPVAMETCRPKRLLSEIITSSVGSADDLSGRQQKRICRMSQLKLPKYSAVLDRPRRSALIKQGSLARDSTPSPNDDADDADDEDDSILGDFTNSHTHSGKADIQAQPFQELLPSSSLISLEDELFGSDATLTSASEYSEEDLDDEKHSASPQLAIANDAPSRERVPSRRSCRIVRSKRSPSLTQAPPVQASAPARVPVSEPRPIRRGPGRPRKDGSMPQPRNGDASFASTHTMDDQMTPSSSILTTATCEASAPVDTPPGSSSTSISLTQPRSKQRSFMFRIIDGERYSSENIAPIDPPECDTEDSLAIKHLLSVGSRLSSESTSSDIAKHSSGGSTDALSPCKIPAARAKGPISSLTNARGVVMPQAPFRRASDGSGARSVPYVRSPIRSLKHSNDSASDVVYGAPPRPVVFPPLAMFKSQTAPTQVMSSQFKPRSCAILTEQTTAQLKMTLQQGLRKALMDPAPTVAEPAVVTHTAEQSAEAHKRERQALITRTFSLLEQTLNSVQTSEADKQLTGRDLLQAMGSSVQLDEPDIQPNGPEMFSFDPAQNSLVAKPLVEKILRLECLHCKKTYKNKRGLSGHLRRCTAARMTSSETEAAESVPATENQMRTMLSKTRRKKNNAMEELDEAIRCVCGSTNDQGEFVQCDRCKSWLHLECVGLFMDTVPDEYFCPPCHQPVLPLTGNKSFRIHAAHQCHSSTPGDTDSDSRDSSETSSMLAGQCLRKYKAKVEDYAQKRRHQYDPSDSGVSSDGCYDEDKQTGSSPITSPQVVLNHDWAEEQTSGFGGHFINPQSGAATATRSIFKGPCSPAVMLDGSSSQE